MNNQHPLLDQNSENSNKKNQNSIKEYGCPCGKDYFSYPALFTHVKQKHNGKPPGQIIKPAAKVNLKRGRPKGIKNGETQAQVINSQISKKLVEPNAISMEFLYFLIKIARDLKDDISSKYTKYNLYYAYLNSYKAEQKSAKLTCQLVFTHFLKQLGQKIGERNIIIHGIVLLLGFFCNFLDEIYVFHENIQYFSQNNSPQDMGYFANSFITRYFPKMSEQFNLQNMQFFKAGNVARTFEYVFQWLYERRYVKHYLRIKPEFEQGI